MTQNNDKENSNNAKPLNNLVLFAMFLYGTALIAILIILPAWDWGWIQGWVYVILFIGVTMIFFFYINQKNPTVLRNRMKVKKTGVTNLIKKEAGSDKWLLPAFGIPGLSTWILPGLNRRFGWTSMPLTGVIIGFLVIIIGVIIFNVALLQNAYASKLLDINEGQKLIDTGLYAHVRHPFYTGLVFWFIGTPFALGSWYSIIPAVLMIVGILMRIKFEEEMLIKGMEGYDDYRTRVKYKLIPKIY